ncbi:hypothetical protein P43SY_000410 [Pythium insidiosum]|uniref:Dual specificity phosphatase n=1 Tax=Pythium insidiosum TaxID=114742 RepID=A0AAD5Q402_PYTIN|nr:hypothetical protein P43SY_000410 [Pythium insidiosum]
MDFLFIGGAAAAKDKDSLQQQGITHIINCAATVAPSHYPDDFIYYNIRLRDHSSQDIGRYFYNVFDFIEKARRRGGKIFVHCVKGISRSPTMAIAYLMWFKRIDVNKALELVRQARPVVDPNAGFIFQLTEWDHLRPTRRLKLQQPVCFRIDVPDGMNGNGNGARPAEKPLIVGPLTTLSENDFLHPSAEMNSSCFVVSSADYVMSGGSSSVALLALTSLIGVGLAVGYVYLQGSSTSGVDGNGGCPFGKLSAEEKKKGGKCPATGTVLAPEKLQEEKPSSPKAKSLQHEPVTASRPSEKPVSPPESPVKASPKTPEIKQEVAPPTSAPPATPPASPVKVASKSAASSPQKSPAKPVASLASEVKCASPPASPAKPASPSPTNAQLVESVLVEETALEVATSFVNQVVLESVENVEDEVAEKDEYVQVELTQSTENIRDKAGWTMPVEELERPVIVDEPVSLLTPPAPEPQDTVESPKIASPVVTPVASPSKPRSRKNSASSAKKLPKTPPPSPVKAELADTAESTSAPSDEKESTAQSDAAALPSPKKEATVMSDDGDDADQEADENEGESAPSSNDAAHTPKKAKSKKKKGKKRR